MEALNVMWTEKYRPKKISDMVGDFKDKISKYLEEPGKMQHLLLHSVVPGTGKTTLAKAIINELGSDKLIMNSSDDRKIDAIREKVNGFVRTQSTKEGMRRIVFMDEADGLTNAAQDALRNLMETYSSNAIFILTCNKIKKISDAIQSRCVTIKFNTPNKVEILNYLSTVCKAEQLNYTEEGLLEIINKNYPSIRNCVQVLQSLHTEGKDIIKENAIESDEELQMLWSKIYNDKDWKYVKDHIFTHGTNVRELNQFIWFKAVDISHIKLIQITASNEKAFSDDGEELIIFITSLIDMVK
jgi:replication factor C small subunit